MANNQGECKKSRKTGFRLFLILTIPVDYFKTSTVILMSSNGRSPGAV